MTALSDRLTKANKPKRSLRALSERAKAAGFTLSHGTVGNALNGTHGHLDDNTLYGLEAALGVPFGEMRELLGLPREATPYEPPAASARLTHTQRDLLDALIHQLVKPSAGEGVSSVTVVDFGPGGPEPAEGLAADTEPGVPSEGERRREVHNKDAERPDGDA